MEEVIRKLQTYRRRVNNDLVDFVSGEKEILNSEDLVRLVGNLNSAYQHLVSGVSTNNIDGALFCTYKHLATALIQAEEVYGDNAQIYEIISLMSDGKITACSACADDSKAVLDV